MDVGMLTVQYLNGDLETFDISDINIDRIKVMEDRIIICFLKDSSTNKNKCKIIITDNLASFEIAPCDLEGLISSMGNK